jgi:hypothetical protein
VGAAIDEAPALRSCSGEAKLRHSSLTARAPAGVLVVAIAARRARRSASVRGRVYSQEKPGVDRPQEAWMRHQPAERALVRRAAGEAPAVDDHQAPHELGAADRQTRRGEAADELPLALAPFVVGELAGRRVEQRHRRSLSGDRPVGHLT